MKLPSKMARVFAFALTMILVSAQWTPALALEGAQWYWTTENDQNPVTYQQCEQRAPSALATTGVASGTNGGWNWVNAPNFYVILVCINRTRGVNVVLSVTAADSSTATQIGKMIGDAFWGSSSGSYPNLAGYYTCYDGPCIQQGGTATVQQNGTELTFINEVGTRAVGRFLDAHTIYVDNWGLRADISADGRTISWSNGVRWVRQ